MRARIHVFVHLRNGFQELLTLEPKSEGETGICLEIFSDQRNTLRTAFSNIIADQTSSSKEKTVPQVHEHLGVSPRGIIEEVSRKIDIVFNIENLYTRVALSFLCTRSTKFRVNFFFLFYE